MDTFLRKLDMRFTILSAIWGVAQRFGMGKPDVFAIHN